MSVLYEVILSPAVLAALFLSGGYFLVRLRGFWLFHPKRTFSALGHGKGVFRAVCLALAGTLGVGNITGVAVALLTGGAGAVFWMLASAFCAMGVKYAEVVLALDTREKRADGWHGGASYYMDGRVFPVLFSLLVTLCAVLEGGLLQSNAVADALSPHPRLCTGILLALLAAPLLLAGKRAIARVNAFIVPAATLLYLVMTFSVIVVFRARVPSALAEILRSAFTFKAGVSGFLGFLFSESARVGCARGLLSNEAGCGTAPTAHATADRNDPARQGVWGIFEVFLDTCVVCLATALALLVTKEDGGDTTPAGFLSSAFGQVFRNTAPALVALSVFLFGFATLLSWYFYGREALSRLTDAPFVRGVYLFLYLLALPVGAVSDPGTAFLAVDILLAVMTLINLFFVMKKADRVVSLSASGGLIRVSRRHADAPRERHRSR